MKLLLFCLLLLTSLYAKDEETCYTVQLFSVPLSTKDQLTQQLQNYPDECQLMEISKTLTMRCGCFEHLKDANKKLTELRELYHTASLAVSYKYRFASTSQTKQKKELSKDDFHDNELRLILQAFLYSQDFPHALETAKIALKEYPNSLYWNQKMAEILRWMGRGEEALKYMEYTYHKTKEPQLAKELIDYALANYQYENIKQIVTEAFLQQPTEQNKQRMLFVYNKIGIPEEAATILKKQYNKTKDPTLLSDALQIYMDLDELDHAKDIITLIQQEHYYTSKNIELISYYYYAKRDIENAFSILKQYNLEELYNQRLNELYSDLGWYLQKYDRAAQASLSLVEHKEARLVDYERLIYVNRTKNPKRALYFAQEAYKKYKLPYLFYAYANLALKERQYKLLLESCNELENENSPLLQEASFYILKSRLYKLLKEKDKAIIALEKARNIKEQTIFEQMQIIDIYMQLAMNKEVKVLLNKLTKNPELPSSYLLPIAALYFTIHDVNQASYYLEKLKERKSELVNTREFLFLQDDIYKAQFNNNAHLQTLRKLRALMQKELQNNPELADDEKFLYDSLRVSLHLDSIETFGSKLQAAKNRLTAAHYNDLSYSLAVKLGVQDMAHEVYLHTKNPPVWLDFADALLQENHTKKANLLFYHLHEIPRDDASYGAHQIGEIALAQTLAFDSLEESEKNKNAYISMLNYTKERSDLFEARSAYYNRDPLLRKYITLNNVLYIDNGLYIVAHLSYYKNSLLDHNILIYVPNTSQELYAGVKKLFDKGEVTFRLGKADSMRSYTTADLKVEYQLNNYFKLKGEATKNSVAEESIELLLGGIKDMLSATLLYTPLNSTSLEITLDKNRYNSQDGVYIGEGTYIQALLGHQLRNGYPDMRIILFGDYAQYSESKGKKGVIEELRKEPYQTLPNDFYNIGLTFNYGMQNSTIYTRVWRPFFEVSSFYNSDLGGLSYSLYAGYGGKVYLQDHLVTAIKYTNDVSGIGGSILELLLNYQFLYTH